MITNRIDGISFKGMMLNGLNNLKNHENEINIMNVFPVADKDTGINMKLTIESGLERATEDANLGKYVNEFALGTLFGARGNSGVILSQFFKGFAKCIGSRISANPHEFTNALIYGYKYAYKSMIKPVEGTILTVMKEGIVRIKDTIRGDVNFPIFFERYVSSLNLSLDNTPNLLPILKESNVLDSGGFGYIKIMEGAYKYWLGEEIKVDDNSANLIADPIENRNDNEVMPFKVLGIITVGIGNVLKEQFKEYGADIVIDGVDSINISKADFVEAIRKMNADKIIVLPNSGNNITKANKVVSEMKLNNVIVIPSNNIAAGFYALQMDVPDNGPINRIIDMKSNVNDIKDIIVSKPDNAIEDFKVALNNIENIDEKVALILFAGKLATDEIKNAINDYVCDNFDCLETQIIEDEEANYCLIGGIF